MSWTLKLNYQRNPDLLVPAGQGAKETPVTQVLTSHLFRSLCPVTAQPDWASVIVSYSGAAIDQAGFVEVLDFYRQRRLFTSTVERIYADIWERCQPEKLSVSGRFLRRAVWILVPRDLANPKQWMCRVSSAIARPMAKSVWTD